MRANRYVSYLAAEIEPAALANARTFEREIERTLERISQKSSRGSGAFASAALGTNATRGFSTISAGATKASRDLAILDAAQLKASRSSAIMGTAFSRSADALQIVQGPLGPLAGRLSALGQVLRSLSGFTLAAVLGGGGAFALGGIATQYQRMHDTLVPVIGDQKALRLAMNDVIGIAGRTHQALQPVAELYTQFSRVGKDAHLSQERIARLTETVSKATKIGGGDPEGQRGALIQFGQALTANFHGSGQELQSILEQTPALANAIAEGLGTQSSKLKQLAKDGQLSTELVVKALEREADTIDERFGRMPARIGKSLQDLENSAAVFVGKMDEATGATTGVANAIGFVADHLRGVVTLAGAVAAAFSAKLFAGAVQGAQAYVSNLVTVNQLTNEQTRFNGIVKAAMREQAVQAVQTAEAEIVGAREYQAQLQANVVLLEKQIAAQARALEMARTLDAGLRVGGGTGSSKVLAASYADLQASERALLLTQQTLMASDAELAAGEVRLAAATQALAVADEELIVAETAAAAATGRLAAAKAFLQGAASRVQGAMSGLVGFMGGPLGVAFTAAATWAMVLASQTDHAKEAIDRFAGGEEALIAKLENTTGKMREQATVALSLARALQIQQISEAKQRLGETGQQIAGDLGAAAINIGSSKTIGGIRFRLPGTGGEDASRLTELAAKAKTATLSMQELREAIDILNRHPEATAKSRHLYDLIGLGGDPKQIVHDMAGILAATDEVEKAQQSLADFDKRQSQKQTPLLGGKNKPTTKAELNAQARVLAGGDDLSQARSQLQLAMREGPSTGETDDQYKQRIAGLIQNVQGMVAAHKAAAKAKAEERHQQALLNKEMSAEEQGRDKAARLAGILDQYSDDSPIKRINQLRDAAERAKRQVDDLIGERVGPQHIFTKADAEAAKAQIDAYEKLAEHQKPVALALTQKQEELNVTNLISKGLGNQAEFIRRKVELEKQYGPLTKDEEQQIRNQITQENRLNDVIAKRQAIIENNARLLDGIRDSLVQAIDQALGGDPAGAAKNFVKNLLAAFRQAKANEIVMKLIGDPGKKYRDDMTRGLNDSADKLSTSGDKLTDAANALNDAAGALNQGAGGAAGGASGAAGGAGGAGKGPSTSDLVTRLLGTEFLSLAGVASVALRKVGAASDKQSASADAIVITAQRTQHANNPVNLTATLDKLGAALGTKIAGPGSILTKVMGKLGTALEGAAYGQAASGTLGAITGLKQSNTGAAIGGAIGAVAGSFIPGVGTVLGSIIGGALGGTVGGLFKKSKYATATLTGGDTGINVGSAAGRGSSQIDAANSLAGSVAQGIQNIADTLGAQIGSFAVSIGVTKKGKYVVDEKGLGRTKTGGGPDDTPEFATQEEAVRYAILNAIQDGAIKGISEGAQRLLRAGQNLDASLNKALKFESVFKDLKRLKDPVGAAIDDLNANFQNLISIFKEAGASAGEWSQLQQLYDLQRADAIKQATADTVSQLNDFIKAMTSGSESPLGRRTVYNNAKAAVDAFRGDITAGKTVDQDALVKALNDFEQASQTLFGSRGQFYSDFQDILDLANKAKDNATAGATTPNPLPPSPFDAIAPGITQLVGGQNTTNDLLTQISNQLGSLGGGGGPDPSTIDMLPFYGGLSGRLSFGGAGYA